MGTYTQPTEADRYQMIHTYFAMLIEEQLPEAVGKMKQFASWFTHGVTHGSHLRKAVYEAKSAGEVLDRVDEFFQKQFAKPQQETKDDDPMTAEGKTPRRPEAIECLSQGG